MAEILFVSLIHIIQNPEAYAGRQVRVVGVAKIRFEAMALYISEDDMKNAVTKNALWLATKPDEATTKLTGKYAIVEGVFDPQNKGHLKMYSGALKDIRRLELWSDPEQKREVPKPG